MEPARRSTEEEQASKPTLADGDQFAADDEVIRITERLADRWSELLDRLSR